jgi:hypothetical protein
MERELWKQLYRLAMACDRSKPNSFYRDWEIVVIYFWAVIHDRPTRWACDRSNWASCPANIRLPNQSTVSRRLRSKEVLQLIQAISTTFQSMTRLPQYLCIDGKPLTIGDHSQDPDARNGWAGFGFAKGYKLHAIWGKGPIPVCFQITSLNVGEPKVARDLVRQIQHPAYIVGDRQYDSNPLHEVARAQNCQLIAEQKNRCGKLAPNRKHSPARIKSFAILKTTRGQLLLKFRDHIERQFGKLTCHGAGLGPLPAWVRTIGRVKLWVTAKLIINALHTIYNKNQTTLALA